MTAKILKLTQLYDRDYHLWLEETAQLLKTKNFIEDMPSLKRLLDDSEAITKAYSRGRRDAIKETGIRNFPKNCPFTIQQVLYANYLQSL